MSDRYARASKIFHAALDRPAAERVRFVRDAAGGDDALRREVESLLGYAASPAPVVEIAANRQPGTLIGRRIGTFEVRARIGAGGMGEVYRAHDHSLGRDVALKVLPDGFARDPGRLARFDREARALAALNHPNIAQVYGLAAADDLRAIAMEFVEGRTLEAVVHGGGRRAARLSMAESLAIARQLADALEAAHEAGIIHRDLKPANVIVRDDGTVKVLDFGLAKALDPLDTDARASAASGSDTGSGNSTTLLSPDVLSPVMTQDGVILGTAGYMAPEQAQGKTVDRRADVWAFGVVLYEMLTGRRAYEGQSVRDVLAKVLKGAPPLAALPTETPDAVRRLLRRCLETNRRQRLADMGAARLEVEDAIAGEPASHATGARRTWLPWAALAAVITTGVVAALAFWPGSAAPELMAAEFEIVPPEGLMFGANFSAALSPDGRHVAYAAGPGGPTGQRIWIRRLDSLDAQPLDGASQGSPWGWSPDSRSIAFESEGKLKRLDISGKASQVICTVEHNDPLFSRSQGTLAWSQDGFILFGSAAGLQRVPASGGTPVSLTSVDPARQETGHFAPQFLPGDKFLFTVFSRDESVGGVYVASMARPADRVRVLAEPSKAIYVHPAGSQAGSLLWVRDRFLMAQRFDVGALSLQGEPVVLASEIPGAAVGLAAFWASDTGTLVYRSGNDLGLRRLIWLGRDGSRLPDATPAPDLYRAIRLSPDGTRVGVVRSVGNGIEVWVLEFARPAWTRVGPTDPSGPFWSPAGREIAIERKGVVSRRHWTGVGDETPLTQERMPRTPVDWSADGKSLLYARRAPNGRSDIWLVKTGDTPEPRLLVGTDAHETGARFSRDGRWVAFQSDTTGRQEVYVQAVVGAGERLQVSTEGGVEPRWRADGTELYYVGGKFDAVMVAAVRPDRAGLKVDVPRRLLTLPTPLNAGADREIEVTADGQRFLVLDRGGGRDGPTPLKVVVNWQARQPK